MMPIASTSDRGAFLQPSSPDAAPAPTLRLSALLPLLAGAVLLGLSGGCSTTAMKGTPFYTGEYAKRQGPAEQRVNLWPAFYYRDPALSVLWPVFEHTEDHFALRPLFSVYGLDRAQYKYNLLWPLMQWDRERGDYRVFPFFAGRDYRVLFPVYWHFNHPFGPQGGSDSLFPLWILNRSGTNKLDLYCPWPLVHAWSNTEHHDCGSTVLPLYRYRHNDEATSFLSPLWMSETKADGDFWRFLPLLYYQSSNAVATSFATPLWAQGRSESRDWRAIIPLAYWDRQQHTLLSPLWARWQTDDHETYFAPWSLSWLKHHPQRNDLWLAGGLAHARWGEEAKGAHHVFPLYYRNAVDHTLLTPLCGWDREGKGFVYPLTPLAGVRTDQATGSWLFPLYAYTREKKNDNVDLNLLLFGGYEHTRQNSQTWFFPLFSYRNDGPLDSVPEQPQATMTYGKKFWSLPFCWYRNQCRVRPAPKPSSASTNATPADVAAPDATVGNPVAPTNAPAIREYIKKNGTFPLWSYSARSTPAENSRVVKGSFGGLLYNYLHEVGVSRPAKAGVVNDYTRASILWRLWHYERTDGNVSVDVFPTITYDRRTDGYSQTSFLWRLFRYEHSAEGARKLDLLFVPVLR